MKKTEWEKKEEYEDFSNVETQRRFLFPEGLPEGAYGSPRGKHTPVENKSSPFKIGQRKQSAYDYQFNSVQQNVPRIYPGADQPDHHDEDQKASKKERPYGEEM
ncbi:cytosolic protein [Bacillus chungangensis]|uniref:Cytosolic protein n=1 Tax=Bacillus chungangensis TaxID=587633 RepID=A0ABT9WWX2_9BACI|nr:cytosolic protein [Bacillus chungangensis]MDQ0177717.1 hypothetical protein [Bacillus chungangensis]